MSYFSEVRDGLRGDSQYMDRVRDGRMQLAEEQFQKELISSYKSVEEKRASWQIRLATCFALSAAIITGYNNIDAIKSIAFETSESAPDTPKP